MAQEKLRVKVVKNPSNEKFIKGIEEFEVNISRDLVLLLPVAYKIDSTVDMTRDDYEMLKSQGLEMEIQEVIVDGPQKDERVPEIDMPGQIINNLDENPIRNDDEKHQLEGNLNQGQKRNEESQIESSKDEDREHEKKFVAETEEDKQKERALGEEFEEKEAKKLREELESQGKKPEEIEESVAQAKTEYIGKFYYLTPDTILESLQKVNGGSFWNYLRANGMQDAVERAYRGCVWPSELSNPEFLEKVISNYLPEGNQIDKTGLKHIHTMALARTYVGYQLEEVGLTGETVEDGKENEDVAVINLPEAVDHMPESLKDAVRDDVYVNMVKIIQDVMLNSDKYTAICALVPMENVFAKAIETTQNRYNEKDVTEGKKVAIVQAMDYKKGYRDELKKDSHEFNINFAIGDINWQNTEERRKVIDLLKMISGKEEFMNSPNEQTIKNVDMIFVINSEADVKQLSATKRQLESFGAQVNVAYVNNAPQEEKKEIEKSIKSEVGVSARPIGELHPIVAHESDLMTGILTASLIGAGMAMTAEKREEQSKIIDAVIDESHIDNYAEELERGTMGKNYATYMLAMEANIPIEIAEQELFEAYMTAHEEAEMGRDNASQNTGE